MTLAPAGGEKQFFFVHMQKAGGTSLWRHLRRQFSPSELYPDPDEPIGTRTIDVDELVRAWPSRRAEVRVVAGHFPLCTTDLLGGGFRTFTLLRDPVERILSSLRAQKQRVPELREMTLEEIYSAPVRREFLRNHMVKMLGLGRAEMTKGALTPADLTSDHLARAQRNLDDLEVVGLCEDFGGFLASLEATFGWRLGPPMYANSTRPMTVTDSFRDRLAEENALDLALYQYAQNLVGRTEDSIL